MIDETRRLAVERQTCDSCGAEPGEPCVTGSGGPTNMPHQPRIAVALIPRDVLSVACDSCGMTAGNRCVSKGARGSVPYHAIRKRKAMFGKQLDMKAGI